MIAEANRLEISIRGAVADVRLNRPDKMNALDRAMFDAIEACGAGLAEEKGVRAVVLSGVGRGFCAGLDVSSLQSIASGADTPRQVDRRTHGIANQPQHVARMWRDLPMPVIAAVHGVAFGGGFQLMLGADIRIVAPSTRMAAMEVKWGLIPDMAGIGFMHELARTDVVRELTFTGREFSGSEALAYGFATQLAEDPYDAACKLAQTIAELNPDALRAAKQLINMVGSASEAELLLSESLMQKSLLGSANQVEAVDARLSRRQAVFRDR